MNILYEYTGEEFKESFAYDFIAETYLLGSSPTNTFSGKRKFDEQFKKEEVMKVAELVNSCKKYYKKGVPSKIILDKEEIELLSRIKTYCESVVFNK